MPNIQVATLLKASMADQAVRNVAKMLDHGEIVDGWYGTAEQLRAAIEDGSLRAVILNELLDDDQREELRRFHGEEETTK